MEKRVYSGRWSLETVKTFIEVRIRNDWMFKQKMYNSRACWEVIGQECDIDVEWRKIKKKWENLRNKYRHILENPKLSDPLDDANDDDDTTNWPHFEALHNFFQGKPNGIPINCKSKRIVKESPMPMITAVESINLPKTKVTPIKQERSSPLRIDISDEQNVPTGRVLKRKKTLEDKDLELTRKLQKKIIKCADVFLTFMETHFNITPPSDSDFESDSET